MCRIAIRPAGEHDMAAVAAIERETFSQPWSEQGLRDTLAFPNVVFLTAVRENTLLGYCVMYCALDEGEITNVAVKETCRRQGIGKKLMEALLEEAGKRAVSHLILEVRVSNMAAIALYESLGFIIQGKRPGFYQCPREDGYVMIRSQ